MLPRGESTPRKGWQHPGTNLGDEVGRRQRHEENSDGSTPGPWPFCLKPTNESSSLEITCKAER